MSTKNFPASRKDKPERKRKRSRPGPVKFDDAGVPPDTHALESVSTDGASAGLESTSGSAITNPIVASPFFPGISPGIASAQVPPGAIPASPFGPMSPFIMPYIAQMMQNNPNHPNATQYPGTSNQGTAVLSPTRTGGRKPTSALQKTQVSIASAAPPTTAVSARTNKTRSPTKRVKKENSGTGKTDAPIPTTYANTTSAPPAGQAAANMLPYMMDAGGGLNSPMMMLWGNMDPSSVRSPGALAPSPFFSPMAIQAAAKVAARAVGLESPTPTGPPTTGAVHVSSVGTTGTFSNGTMAAPPPRLSSASSISGMATTAFPVTLPTPTGQDPPVFTPQTAQSLALLLQASATPTPTGVLGGSENGMAASSSGNGVGGSNSGDGGGGIGSGGRAMGAGIRGNASTASPLRTSMGADARPRTTTAVGRGLRSHPHNTNGARPRSRPPPLPQHGVLQSSAAHPYGQVHYPLASQAQSMEYPPVMMSPYMPPMFGAGGYVGGGSGPDPGGASSRAPTSSAGGALDGGGMGVMTPGLISAYQSVFTPGMLSMMLGGNTPSATGSSSSTTATGAFVGGAGNGNTTPGFEAILAQYAVSSTSTAASTGPNAQAGTPQVGAFLQVLQQELLKNTWQPPVTTAGQGDACPPSGAPRNPAPFGFPPGDASQGDGSSSAAAPTLRGKKSKRGDDPGEGIMYTVTEKGFQCLHCRHATKRKSDIKKHFRTHSKDKPYKCDECEKSFSDPSTRSRHMRGHTGRTKFFCGFENCSKDFGRKVYIERHVRQAHLNLDPDDPQPVDPSSYRVRTVKHDEFPAPT
eukprot:m.1544326 g.1544326  ORF g.1544326 m.1544326 type:complete len:806 (-) comp25258_c0_seq3:9301-11718(-)